ncbi:MAG: DUF2254 domain-containing protein [Nocardioidaceae bacterium]
MSRRRTDNVWTILRDAFRTQLWPLPGAAVLVAVAIGTVLPQVEAAHDGLLPQGLHDYLFSGGADAARTVLDTVASSLITVTALTFSLTVVTLQLASSQFSPRLLRTFTRDLVVQSTLGLFLGTFAYALTVLRTVRTSASDRAEFVPDLSVTVGYLLAVASVMGLVLFLAHLARTIRVESMLRSVHDDASSTIDRSLSRSDEPPVEFAALLPSSPRRLVHASSSGFLVRIIEDDLVRQAVSADGVIVVEVCPGASIVDGAPIGAVFLRPGVASEDLSEETLAAIGGALVTGFERTAVQDVSFGLRQLTDVAVKALSPGINDPTTAVHALGHSSALLGVLAAHDLGPRVLRDEDGAVRVVLARADLRAMLHLALEQVARYGAREPAVLVRCFQLLRELAWVCRPHQRAAVAAELARLRRLLDRHELDVEDRARLAGCAEQVDAALAGTWEMETRG